MVSRLVRDQEAMGSNPVTPTIQKPPHINGYDRFEEVFVAFLDLVTNK